MNLVIKRTGSQWGSTKTLRAYTASENEARKDMPLGISSSTTGNEEWGVCECAAKALAFLTFGDKSKAAQFRNQISVRELSPGVGVWRVMLAPKKQEAAL